MEAFRVHLQEELVRRCRANPSYSLRAFARFLQTDHSTLAKLLNGKRPLGKRIAKKFADRLSLAPDELQALLEQPSRSEHEDYQRIALDSFQVISEWYHFAILELMRVKGFKADPRWIANALGISLSEVHSARDRLIRVGMLAVDKDGSWRELTSSKTTVFTPDTTTSAQRLLQKRILEQAIEALDSTPVVERDQTAMTMAIDKRRLPEAKKKITTFRRSLAKFLSRSSERHEVYHLGISLYPVSKTSRRIS